MAIAKLFFKKGNYLGNIDLDVIITEGATATAKVTENPVENGADINDHIIIKPMTFTMTGVISNASSTILGALKNPLGSQTKAQTAWEDMLKLMAFRTYFNLHQGLKTYERVILTSLAETQNKDTSNALFFTATLSEIILVGSGSPTDATFDNQNTADKMTPKTNGGLKPI